MVMEKKVRIDIASVLKEIRESSQETRVYVGCDSILRTAGKGFKATYATVVVIHKDGCRGCQVYGEIVIQPFYGSLKERMFNEAMLAANMAMEVKPHMGGRVLEVHLDINTDPNYGSHVAIKEAAGYVRGLVGIEPKFKPDAPIASGCADRFGWLYNEAAVAGF
jgi:predicted RNase H-related nuclease YkuK (DUF458 family)